MKVECNSKKQCGIGICLHAWKHEKELLCTTESTCLRAKLICKCVPVSDQNKKQEETK